MQYSINANGEKKLQLQAAWDPVEVKAYIDQHGITEVNYFEAIGETRKMGAVLELHTSIKDLLVNSSRIHDWSFLQSFVHLERLSFLAPSHASMDLSACTQLHYASVPWHERIGFHSLPNLRHLTITHYTPVNLKPFAGPPSLRFLLFLRAHLQSLDGIADLAGLQTLALSQCRHLRRIAALNGLPELQGLMIKGSAKVKDYARLTDLPALEELRLDCCGDIPSITFLRKLKSLKEVRLGGNTRVADKNTRPLEEIPKASYDRAMLKHIWGPRSRPNPTDYRSYFPSG